MAPQKKGQKQRNNTKKKPKVYAEKDLNLPVLNTVAKPGAIQKKRKKGKVFIEDQDTLLGILAEVNDAKDGQIRSKLERVKDLEAVRERKRIEMEKKERSKAAQLEKKKGEIKQSAKKRVDKSSSSEPTAEKARFCGDYRNKKKAVSFA